MSLLNVDTVEPEGATTDLTLGAGGDKVVIPGTIKISGGSPGADKLLTSDADGDATWEAASTGGFLGLVVYTADGTYTPGGTANGTAGDEGSTTVSKIIVEVLSAGGGSGSNGGALASGGAGGAGAYALKVLDIGTDRAVITTCTPTVGAAGAAATTADSFGAVGGSSSFSKTTGSGSFTTVTTAGGLGGAHNTYVPGGFTAAPTTGDINIAGCKGTSANNSTAYDAQGGDSKYGFGGRGNPSSGVGYGVGGTCTIATHQSGTVGLDGIIVIWEYA